MNFDWNVFLMSSVVPVLLTMLLTFLTGLAASFIPYAFALGKSKWEDFASKNPNLANNIVNAILLLAPTVVNAVEQERKKGNIPSLDEAKKAAVSLMETWLRTKGITVDLEPFADMISSAIEAEVIKLPPFSGSVSNQPNPTVTTVG